MDVNPPTVSIVIPVYNDEERLRRCLNATLRQTYPEDRMQVIVVDNAPQPSLGAMTAEFPSMTFLHEATPGSYAARNRGLRDARGTVLAFTDADCLPEPGWLEAAVARLERPDHPDIVGGQVMMFAADPARPTAPELFDMAFELDQRHIVEDLHYAATANLVTRRAVIDRIGPFAHGLLSSGDAEWCGRVRAAGGLIVFEPTAAVRHPARRSWSALARKTRRHIGGINLTTLPSLGVGRVLLRAIFMLVTPIASLRHVPRGWRLAGGRGAFGLYVACVFIDVVRLVEFAHLRLGGRPVR